MDMELLRYFHLFINVGMVIGLLQRWGFHCLFLVMGFPSSGIATPFYAGWTQVKVTIGSTKKRSDYSERFLF